MTKGKFLVILLIQICLGWPAVGLDGEYSEYAAGFVRPTDFLCGRADGEAEGLVQACIGTLETTLSRHPYRFVHLTFREQGYSFSRTYPLDLLPEQAADFHNLDRDTVFTSFAIYHLNPLGSNYGSLVMIWDTRSSRQSGSVPDKLIVYPPQFSVERYEFTDLKRRSSIQPEELP
ncbi:MAG: hypothetical protein HRT45_18715 [Bdellovibrionales bacterium]|nr:hypothetical protein [Bdellovibrionales bacterium]